MLGSFDVQPLDPLICSPVSMVEKNSMAMHCITHLSHPQGSSINSFIAPEDAETHYQTFEAAVQLVAHQGQGLTWQKRILRQHFTRSELAGDKGPRKILHRLHLPFGASILCAVFEDIATLIHWVVEKTAGQRFIHYMDDFFTVHKYFKVCGQTMQTLKQVCQEINMLSAPEKSEGPVTVVEFLGLILDTQFMVVCIPPDKLLHTYGFYKTYNKSLIRWLGTEKPQVGNNSHWQGN